MTKFIIVSNCCQGKISKSLNKSTVRPITTIEVSEYTVKTLAFMQSLKPGYLTQIVLPSAQKVRSETLHPGRVLINPQL